MAGLNDIITNKAMQQTTLPSWFDTAQQNVVNQAQSAFGAAPTPQQTVAQNAVNQLAGPTNAFTTAANTAQSIASGAANPWIVTPQYTQTTQPNFAAVRDNPNFQGRQDTFGDVSGSGVLPVGQHLLGMPDMGDGNRMNANLPTMGGALGGISSQAQGQPSGYSVAPNPYTALGGLFAAQNQQLQQLMPNITAPVEGANIASGQFGSLRGQTAVNKAMADAQAQLAAQQMQAALQNQATGVNAASTVGNLTQQDIKNLLEVGQYQQASPFVNVSNLGKVLGGIQAPTTVYNQTQLSPLNQIGGLISLLSGPSGSGGGLLGQIGIKGGLGDLIKGIGGIFTGGGSSGDVYVPGGGGTQNPYIPNPDPTLDNRDVGQTTSGGSSFNANNDFWG